MLVHKIHNFSITGSSILLFIVSALLSSSSIAISSSSSSSIGRHERPTVEQEQEQQHDPFVTAAPLTIAVACRDGVAIIAATSVATARSLPKGSNDTTTTITSSDSEPLLYYNFYDMLSNNQTSMQREQNSTFSALKGKNSGIIAGDNFSSERMDDDENGYPFLDLPDTFMGPYRIQSLGTTTTSSSSQLHTGAAFVSCGWKADGYIRLLNMARSVIDTERYTFGNDDYTLTERSMSLLVNKLSLYMTHCARSDRIRSLSCTALIGSISDSFGDTTTIPLHGCVWFIDVTGAYPVRAHCMGGGTISIRSDKQSTIHTTHKDVDTKSYLLSDVINRELQYRLRTDFISSHDGIMLPYYNMTTDEAFVMILDLLSTEHSNILTSSNTMVSPQTRFELLCIKASSLSGRSTNGRPNNSRIRHIRKRISSIWGVKKSKGNASSLTATIKT